MPKATNDERRAVANLLRVLAGNGMWDEISDYYDSVGPSRIADLIDPDGEGPETTPNCSELLRTTRKYSEVTPKPGCPDWDGECMRRVTRRAVEVDTLLALAEEMDRDGRLQRERQKSGKRWFIDGLDVREYARRIRAACGDGAWPEPDRKEAVRNRPFRERLTGGSDR